MQDLTTFTGAGWAIDAMGSTGTVWRIYDGLTSPLLRYFLKPLTVTANNDTKPYTGVPHSGGNGVTPYDSDMGDPQYAGTSQGATNIGSYTIIPSGLYSYQQGYDIIYVNGTLTINPVNTIPDILPLINEPVPGPPKTLPTSLWVFAPSDFSGTQDVSEDGKDTDIQGVSAIPGVSSREAVLGIQTIPGTGKVILNGTTRIWNPGKGTQSIPFTNGEWITITPEGYYSSSARGFEYLNIVSNNNVYSMGQFYDVFYRPDIVAENLKGENMTGLPTINEALKNTPPTVRFTSVPGETGDAKVKVCYQVQSKGGGIGEVRLFHNGKLAASDGFYRETPPQSTTAPLKPAALNSKAIYQEMRSIIIKEKEKKSTGADTGPNQGPSMVQKPKGDLVEACVELEPVGGENDVSLIAFNAPNTVQSVMKTATFTSTRNKEESRLYVLAVGIDRYKDASINLTNAAKDASDFLSQLADKAETIYKPANIHLTTLLNEQAGKENIVATIDKMASQIQRGDSFIFFDASHGLLLQNQYYIVTSSFDGTQNFQNSLISSNEIVAISQKIKALSQLYIFDTCHAGGVDDVISGLYDARMSVLGKKMGLHIYASADSLEAALDGYKGNGLYTYTLLSGLKNGMEVDKIKSGTVTIKSLGNYSKEMTTEIGGKLGYSQTPMIFNFGKDNSLFWVR